ncbi:hypothetical protein KL930_000681 [Ogataea haglerorum]|uniref:Actin-related protein 2/3 complex subunit 3 n=1 Tax=Ogataea haglerorum TaxID=1937702 RepID=A0AAN6DBI2_9ASCO|nr:uncharacterized protein KL911_003364 [Ogataea haglerorum]KAG7699994.1 hypothetical protein KL915_000683 [Ogataea haglerorum]KAG7701652.1 hypothetical protein KL951_000108 [Ogataea haglerorum]KAG7711466.1 hypothetical protein KL914_000108 [Ogataea haglerorum]KAG7712237.1 hypothetical protein KL950_000108 [Ogataea haglerorum]KAG7722288.1 hypothetical protein KL913_000108 [Ogataea haglerorum]
MDGTIIYYNPPAGAAPQLPAGRGLARREEPATSVTPVGLDTPGTQILYPLKHASKYQHRPIPNTQAYHSTFLADESQDTRLVGNFAVLPLRTRFKGPAFPASSDYDIIDEVLDLFRANSFFKNFEIKGPADRTLIYGILFVSQCLNALNASTPQNEALRVLTNLALDNFSIPGEVGFPLNSLYQPPRDKNEALFLRQYLAQFRQELANRLIARIYKDSNMPSKYWLAFTRRKFMNKSL